MQPSKIEAFGRKRLNRNSQGSLTRQLTAATTLTLFTFLSLMEQQQVQSITIATAALTEQSDRAFLSDLVDTGIQLVEGEQVRLSFQGPQIPQV